MLRIPTSAWLLILVGLATACAGSDRPNATQSGVEKEFQLESWSQLQLCGFVVSTNAPEPQVRRLLAKLCRFVDLLDAELDQREEHVTSHRRLFVFRDLAQFQQLARQRELAHTRRSADHVTIGVPADLGAEGVPILFHELVHLALYEHPSFAYPLWYHEGMAELLSTAMIRENLATLGNVPARHRATLERFEALPLGVLLGTWETLELEGGNVDRFYADSWAMVRFLHGRIGAGAPSHHAAMLRFVGLASAGTPWRQAFDASFKVPLEEFAQDFDRFRREAASGVSHVWYAELPEQLPDIHLESLAASEAALRLGAYANEVEALPLSRAFYDYARTLDPAIR